MNRLVPDDLRAAIAALPPLALRTVAEACARVCGSRAESLSEEGRWEAAGEAYKCGSAIRSGFRRELDALLTEPAEEPASAGVGAAAAAFGEGAR